MKRVDVVYAFIFNDEENKVLMVNNIGGSWTLPGGTVEEGETLEQAVIREVKEETNLTIKVEEIIAINETFRKEKGNHVVFFTFKAKVYAGECSIQYKEEIAEIKWVDIKTANELMPYHPGKVQGLLNSAAPYIFQK